MLQFCYSLVLAWGSSSVGAYENPRPLAPAGPSYTTKAKRERVQGTVVLNVRVSAEGAVERMELVNRLGAGLDDQALRAVSRWQFAPARVDGAPVPAWTVVKVNFRLAGEWFDTRQEELRTEFASAERQFAQGAVAVGRKRIEALARQNYPPAVHWLGRQSEDSDPDRALRLYREAAAGDWAPAIFDEGRLTLRADEPAGVARITDASVLGHQPAREWLGRYWAPRDPARARRYFRLCAMAGVAECQWELGRLLSRAGTQAEQWQALAWFSLAADQGHAAALRRWDEARAGLDAAGQAAVAQYRASWTALASIQ